MNRVESHRPQKIKICYMGMPFWLLKETYSNGSICLSLVDIDTGCLLSYITHNPSDIILPYNHVVLKDPYDGKSGTPILDYFPQETFTTYGILEDLIGQGMLEFKGTSYRVSHTRNALFPICTVNVEYFGILEMVNEINK